MKTINVQFSNSNETAIISFFCSPQDPTDWPNQGVVEATDSRWKDFFNSLPGESQRALPVPE
ncbi:hypothetical protein [Caballeronia sp. LZ035]|uniref:hypothetical protein n=1 Tax=Caballeronia sp. LZ035 TaxID=3038568 RepID=UPI00285B4068|nr:hypothetical protein [Caballeronia sp. LZ035]MDR5757035.1 hypothetical protein [Caballeronia sp. LZ035]